MPKGKLDLMNTRVEGPSSQRVFDSLEDRSLVSEASNKSSKKTLVKMSPNNIIIKTHPRRERSKMLPARFEYLKYDRRGKIIEIQERVASSINQGRGSLDDLRGSLASTNGMFSPDQSLSLSSQFSPSYTNNDNNKPLSASLLSPNLPISLVDSPSLLSRDGLLKQVLAEGLAAQEKEKGKGRERDRESSEEEEEDLSHLNAEERKKFFRRKKYEKMKRDQQRQKDKEKEENYHPTLDKLRDKLYEDTSYKLIDRVRSKKLPGASWSDVDRDLPDPNNNPNTGPGYYDVDLPYSKHASNAGKFNATPREKAINVFATSDRIINAIDTINFDKDLEYFPLQEKQRITRQIAEMHQKYPKLIELKTSSKFRDFVSPPDCALLRPHIPNITFSAEPRFDSIHYRQEPHVKTTGMTLSGDYDKPFNKKIVFKFTSRHSGDSSLAGTMGAESRNVDVDGMKYFETGYVVMKSSLSYAASFRSSAKAGLDIPPPTTAPHIGPGSFNPHKSSLEVKEPHRQSLAFLSYKKPLLPSYSPDTFLDVPSFSEVNDKGPFFSDVAKESNLSANEGESRNRHVQAIVKEKMTQIYPRLAEKKFPLNNGSSSQLGGFGEVGGLERGKSSARIIGSPDPNNNSSNNNRSIASRGNSRDNRSRGRATSPLTHSKSQRQLSPLNLNRSPSSKKSLFSDSSLSLSPSRNSNNKRNHSNQTVSRSSQF